MQILITGCAGFIGFSLSQRLLESNVRSFLQNRTKVNRGIRDTIVNEPERFTAYNNGITIIPSISKNNKIVEINSNG